MHRPRKQIGRNGNHAGRSERHRRDRHIVVARPHGKAVVKQRRDVCHIGDIPARLFDADDIRMAAQTFQRAGLDGASRPRRNIV